MEEEIKKTEYKNIYELEQECIRLTTDLKKRGIYKGFKDTLTKLYTKSGHFVFELIQNAEDCDAEEIIFDLKKEELIFQHNGKKLFTLENVDAITNIGNSTKNDNGNSIGKFGVGFKSVFEYTNTPEVHSGEYHFIIKDMFIPHLIEKSDFCSNTVFHLPFDITEKQKDDCFNEIGETLKNLNPETLLFLSHIKKIVCRINSEEIILQRKNISPFMRPKNLCTLTKNKSGEKPSNTNYIRFFNTIKVDVCEKDENNKIKEYEKEIQVGIAFKSQLNEKSEWSIKPIIYNNVPAGKVFTFFPCEAEKSGLCFHIHAPFALTVDREKLRKDPGNEAIKNKIADLLSSSLTSLKEDNLLNMDFLKTLPNKEDDLGANENNSSNYEMFKKIFEIFDNEPFTPMENGSFEPAKGKYRSKNRIGTLFSDEDMNRLYGTEGKSYWIKNPRQLNQRDDKFIQSLSCKDYNLNNFLDDYSKEKRKYDDIKESLKNPNFVRHDGIKKIIIKFEKISEIFSSKKSEWFCKFYLQLKLLMDDIYEYDEYKTLQDYPFCYCSDSKLYNFSQCYIPSKDFTSIPENIHFLNSKICEETEKNDRLKDFFDSIGLKEYSKTEIFKNDFSNFLRKKITEESFVEIFRNCKELSNEIDTLISSNFYQSYRDMKFLISNDEEICAPCNIYLTSKYGSKIKNIGLYFSSLKNSRLKPLSDKYSKLLNDDELEYFKRFLTNFGCKDSAEIYETICSKNRHWHDIYMNSEGYGSGNSQPTSIDFNVEGLEEFLVQSSFEKFEFVWSFLQNTTVKQKINRYYERDASYCYYTTAQKYELKKYSSELTNILAETKWVAQEDNGSIKFVIPAKAYISQLPEYYKNQFRNTLNYNLHNWLERIEFGKEEKENEEAYQHQLEEEKKQKEELEKLSQNVGVSLNTLSELKQAQNEGLLTDDELKDFINSKRRAKQDREDFVHNNSQKIDEERLSEKALERFKEADGISTEKKERTVRTTNTGIKDAARVKLRNRYTSQLNGNMLCQICQNPMPFKDKTDNDYFVTRQLFASKIFEKELDENYIALCPICDAKYKVYMAQDEEKQQELKQAIIDSKAEKNEFSISLDYDYKLHFHRQHIVSLYSCLSGVEIETPKKVTVIIHKKSETQKVQKNNNSKAFCINCKTTFEFILNKPVISCPNCKKIYKNLNGTLQLMTNSNRGDIFFDCPYCHRKIQKIHRENHIEKCRKKSGI